MSDSQAAMAAQDLGNLHLHPARPVTAQDIADFERDADLLQAATVAAERLLAENPLAVEQHLQRWLGHADELVKV